MSPMQTFAPSLAYRNAIARPRPLAPPVMNTLCVMFVLTVSTFEFVLYFGVRVLYAYEKELVPWMAEHKRHMDVPKERFSEAPPQRPPTPSQEARRAKAPKPKIRTYTSEAPGEPPWLDALRRDRRPTAEPERSRTTPSAGNRRR